MVLGGLIGAIAWNLITWYFGIPSSSSHALIGGYAGAAVARVGVKAIIPGMAWVKTLAFIVLSPLIGMAVGFGLMVAVSWIFHKTPYGSVDRWFRRAQLGSAAAFSLSHGTNDAQKTMGIIAGLLVANHAHFADPASPLHWMHLPDMKTIPWWIILSAHAAIGLGTLHGRLADRADHGKPDHQAEALLRLLRRDRRGRHRHRGVDLGHPGLDDAHDHRARSSASAPRSASRRCAGASRDGSSTPGS